MSRIIAAVFTLFWTLLIVQSAGAQTHAPQTRGAMSLYVEELNGGKNIALYGRSFALVIGIDNYTNGWPPLGETHNDARAVAKELERHGFDVSLQLDLKSRQLKQVLEDFIYDKGQYKNARLFIWFAGHGHTINGEGYLVPSDAPPPKTGIRFRRKALSLRRFGEFMREANAKHVLTVFDSCFSGTVFSAARALPPAIISLVTTKKVRQFVSSGQASQVVSDNGAFRKLFVDALQGKDGRADMNGDGYILGSELGLFLRQEVTNLTEKQQTPRYGKLRARGYNLGDFVFEVGEGRKVPDTVKPAENSVLAAMRKRLAALEARLKKRDQPAQKPAPETQPEQPEIPPVLAKQTKKQAMIKETQTLLARLGYKPGPADGQYGLNTRDAITAFQRDKGTTGRRTYGQVDQRLLTALKIAARTRNIDARRKAREARREAEKKVAVGVFAKESGEHQGSLLECWGGGWTKVSQGEIATYRRKGYLVKPRSRDGRTIWCIKSNSSSSSEPGLNEFKAGYVFNDCNGAGWCPSMVVVPRGTFMMGSPQSEKGRDADEDDKAGKGGKRLRVSIRSKFAVGRFEITRGQFDAFVKATRRKVGKTCKVKSGGRWRSKVGYNYRRVGFSQSDDHPVVCVNWWDVGAYLKWLNKKTGKSYRLLNEAEWEYVARAGTNGTFSFTGKISTARANYDGTKTYDGSPVGKPRKRTVPVDSFKPNPFGLYNVHGNVWEWVGDWYQNSYAGAAKNGRVKITGRRVYRSLRGGAWGSKPSDLRSAGRFGVGPHFRSASLGFRVARSLD